MGTSFLEKATNITYSSDAPYIDTGIGRSIKSSYQSKSEQQTWYKESIENIIKIKLGIGK